MIAFRMMWKDWGFAAALRDQAKHFSDLAKQTATGSEQDGYVRASIVFSVMSFEAFFFREIIRGYIQQHATTLNPATVQQIEHGVNGTAGSTGIAKALKKWPHLLTYKALAPACTDYFSKLLEYRNALIHGDITRALPAWGQTRSGR